MITAEITAGAVNNSTSVTVTASVANGTIVVVYRGGFWLGEGVIASGVATVPVLQLATGDIIQASVNERGNQAGIPIPVEAGTTQPTGWLDPASVRVTNPNGTSTDYTASGYTSTFGEQVGSIYDPAGSGLTTTPPEYEPADQVELGFDVSVTMQPGQTSLLVIPRSSEGILVGFNGGALGSNAPFTVTASGSVAVAVKRDDSPVTLSRTVSVTVLPAPEVGTPSAGDITSYAYRLYEGSNNVNVFINSAKLCQARLNGDSWVTANFYGSRYQEVAYNAVPGGTHLVEIRVNGDTTAANWKSMTLIV